MNTKGFTLIEIIIVITIIVVLFGVVFVNLNSTHDSASEAVGLVNSRYYELLEEDYRLMGLTEDEIEVKLAMEYSKVLKNQSGSEVILSCDKYPIIPNGSYSMVGTSCQFSCNANPTNGSYIKVGNSCQLSCEDGYYKVGEQCLTSCPSNPSNGSYTIVGETCQFSCNANPTNGSYIKVGNSCQLSCEDGYQVSSNGSLCETPSVEESQKLIASNAQANDNFGIAVSIDGNTAIVGARLEDTGGTNAGAAYIFEKSGSSWTQTAKIQASDAQAYDNFGTSVSISGNTVIVGSHGESTGGTFVGAAYIFEKSGSSWTETTKIQASDKQAYDLFGNSVSISGNIAIVGAYREDTGGNNAGAAYIYEKGEDGNWTETKRLTASDAEANDLFGWSVSISGTTSIVSSFWEDTGASDAGAAYIFEKQNETWIQTEKLIASDALSQGNFGESVSISGNTAIVGAEKGSTGGTFVGAVYIFEKSGSSWTETAKIQASDGEEYDSFGLSVSISGATAIVGARYKNTGGDDAGAAYIFEKQNESWIETKRLTASDVEANDFFGWSVSISGTTAIVGAHQEDTGGSNTGAAYIFEN